MKTGRSFAKKDLSVKSCYDLFVHYYENYYDPKPHCQKADFKASTKFILFVSKKSSQFPKLNLFWSKT